MKTMTASSLAKQRALLTFALVGITAGYLQGCASKCACKAAPDAQVIGAALDAAPLVGLDARSSDTSRQTGFSTWSYQGTPMGLYVPASTGTPLPVVMYLHGCHNDPVSPDYWIIAALNAVEPVAVFLPTAPPSIDFTCADWGGTYDEALRPNMKNALAELNRLMGEYGFDTSRQYLYGESMGGEGVFRLLADFPTRFAGAVAAAGYTINKGASQMAQTPLWIFHGSDDSISPVANDQAIYQAILAAGGTQVKYTEYPGLDHVPAIEQARVQPGLFNWLLAQYRR